MVRLLAAEFGWELRVSTVVRGAVGGVVTGGLVCERGRTVRSKRGLAAWSKQGVGGVAAWRTVQDTG